MVLTGRLWLRADIYGRQIEDVYGFQTGQIGGFPGNFQGYPGHLWWSPKMTKIEKLY
jgi:hypothetical protein